MTAGKTPVPGARQEVSDPYVRLALEAVSAYARDHVVIDVPAWVPSGLLEKRAAVFVSLHEDGRLRGCIGTLLPYRTSAAEEVVGNAVSACSKDPRFDPVRPDELAGLTCSVDVLSPLEPCTAAGLDPVHYGVVVERGWRRGVLLPHLDGVDTVEGQVAIAKQKAGIAPSQECELKRFTVTRHFADHAERL